MPHSRKNGFTLIELLVVISIIGVLSSIVLSAMKSAKIKANDSLRIQDIHSIKNALELYHLDNGVYPPDDDDVTHDIWVIGVLRATLVPKYIAAISPILIKDWTKYYSWGTVPTSNGGFRIVYTTKPDDSYLFEVYTDEIVSPGSALPHRCVTGSPNIDPAWIAHWLGDIPISAIPWCKF